MKFINRKVEFPNRRKLTKLDANGQPLGETLIVDIEKLEEEIVLDNQHGTPISAENLNKGNWRDDESLSFLQQVDDVVPESKSGVTQIVTLATGETWLITPLGRDNIRLDKISDARVLVNGVPQDEWETTVKQDKNDNSLNTTSKNVTEAINEIFFLLQNKLAHNGTAVNSSKLGGFEASYFATKSSVTTQGEAINTQQTNLSNHTNSSSTHVTSEEKEKWNGKTNMLIQSTIPDSLEDNTICFIV